MTVPAPDKNTKQEIDAMWEMYWVLEQQFIEFSSVIPIKTNPWYINSMNLLVILQSSCSQVEQLMRLLVRGFTGEEPNPKADYPDLFELLNRQELLSKQVVILHAKPEKILYPFNNLPTPHKIPEWWYANNKTKHEILTGRYLATIGETLNALAALYVLNRIANVLKYVPMLGTNEHIFDGRNWIKFSELVLSQKIAEGYSKAKHAELGHSQVFYHPFSVAPFRGVLTK